MEQRLYNKLGMENPNKPKVYTSTVKEGPTIHRVRIVAHDGSKKLPPPVAAKPIFYKATVQPKKVPEKAQAPSTFDSAESQEKKKGAKSMEDELADLTDLLVKNLDNTSDPDFYGKNIEVPKIFIFKVYFRVMIERNLTLTKEGEAENVSYARIQMLSFQICSLSSRIPINKISTLPFSY